jgi:protocatechuate 3,4-dioxygenase beta subunit
MSGRIQRTLVGVGVWLVSSAAVASAQTIRGTVVDASDRPVGGVVVFMLDSTSAVVARALTSETGDFRVATTRAGSYRLRTMRIGYRPTTTEPIVALLGGETTRRVVLSGAAVALDTVRVVDRNSCRVASDSTAAATYAVLEQARTALAAAQLTLGGRTISATTIAYERTLDPDGRRVVRQSSRTSTAYVTQPWRAISPDSAHRAGFVFVARDNSTTYFAPSIDILLSDAFIEDHCFRLTTDRRQRDVVGVAFEPSSDRRKLPEIKGTLWVNRATAALERLEYRYVNISSEQESAGAGGEVSFAPLKNGGWVIARWSIRMPLLEQVVRTQALGGTQAHVAGIQVSGGEVQLVTRASGAVIDTLWTRPGLPLSGTVIDSARGSPIANARVDLVGAALSAVTDARGRFSIANVLPGTYQVETRTPDLEAIGAANQSTIDFTDSTESYEIRVPNAAQLTAALCPGRHLSSSESAIVGRIYPKPEAAARVLAEWIVITPRDEHGIVFERSGRKLEGKTSTDGAYRLCGVPANTTMTVTAMAANAASEPRTLRTATRIVRADLVVSRAMSTTAAFTGRVLVDSLNTPIEGAEIYFPELSKAERSLATGEFQVSDIPAGPQHVVIRRIGYGGVDTTLTFEANTALDRQIFLSPATVLDSVIVSDKMTDRALADFEFNRRLGIGHFLDRAELEKLRDVRLSRVVAQWPGIRMLFGTGGRAWITGTRKAPPPCPPVSAACFESAGWYWPEPSEAQLGVKAACYAQVYVDGVLMNHGHPTRPYEVNELYTEQIEALEWYAGPSETPGQYANLNSDCGVLVVHTRRTP